MSHHDTERLAEAVASAEEILARVAAVDHHCHGIARGPLGAAEFADLATESDWPQPLGGDVFDAPAGVAIRALCAPLLGLPRHATGPQYLRRRAELGPDESAARLLREARIGTYLVDTGHRGAHVTDPGELARITGARAGEVVRLEPLAEQLVRTGVRAEDFLSAFTEQLDAELRTAIGVKSVIAYRFGLDFEPVRPGAAAVRAAAAEWLAHCREAGSSRRLDHPVLLRALLWAAVDAGKPIQMHVGYGDSDITLHRCDPTQMTGFLRATADSGTNIMLLHNYPFVREAGYLAQVYPHVYFDTGAAVGYTGASSLAVIRQSLELAPFTKLLFSTDAFGLPELYVCGAHLQRMGLASVFGEWLAADAIGPDDAARYLELIMASNARRVYRLADA